LELKTDDHLLLNQIAEGNELAFCELYYRHVQFVYAAAFRLLKDESSAEDVVQEAFLKLWVNRERLSQVSNFPAYLHVLIRNHIYNKFRRMAYEETNLLGSMPESHASGRDTIEEVYYNELKAGLAKAVSQLTPQQKKAYLLSR
jgi:RNA polymerase sigma factor (sigma-70 family)